MFIRDFLFTPSAGRAGGASSDPEVRQKSLMGKSLKVTMTASHAGKLTGNFGLYTPSMIKNSCTTFVAPYGKPVQVHHDSHSDPIGRVTGARYVPYRKSDLSADEVEAVDLLTDAVSKKTVLKAAQKLEESGLLFQKDWEGVGELELEALINDSEAIQKILDGRYLTVSIGMKPLSAYCSICGKDWVSEDRCSHERGEKDKESGRVMYLIPGRGEYREVSYINHPADLTAMNKEAEMLDAAFFDAFIGETSITLDNISDTKVAYEMVDSIGEGIVNMPKDREAEVPKPEPETKPEPTLDEALRTVIEDKDSFTKEMSILVNQEIEDAVLKAKTRKALPTSAFCGPGRTYPAHDKAHAVNALARVKQFGSPALQARVRACVCRKFSGLPACQRKGNDETEDWSPEILAELDRLITHPDTGKEVKLGDYVFGIADEAMTPEQIVALPDSAFVGPMRSFHVVSPVHVDAALELLSKYEGEGDASWLQKAIEDKGKLFGYTVGENEPEGDDEDSSCLLSSLGDEDLLQLSLDMEKELISRDLRAPRDCADCARKDEKLAELDGKLPELEETVEVLRREHKMVTADCIAADKALIETTAKLEKIYRGSLVSFKLLLDKETSKEDIEKAVTEASVEDLEKELSDVDLSEVVDFVRSGLANKPEGDVTPDDADVVSEEDVEGVPGNDEELLAYARKLVTLVDKAGRPAAERYLVTLKQFGKISHDFSLDKAREVVAE